MEFAREKESLFDSWCTASTILREVLLLEEFKNSLPERLMVYLNEQKVASLSHAAVLADEFVLTHKTSSQGPQQSNRKCFYCHETGHIVADCSVLKRKQIGRASCRERV